MRSAAETLQPYADAREWLEGKRRFVRILRQYCGCAYETKRFLRDPSTKPDPDLLVAAMDWHDHEHQQRVALTRQAGTKLPIDEFVAELGLDEVEREIVELLLVTVTDMTGEEIHGGLRTSEIVLLLARGKQDRVQDFLPYFMRGRRLWQAILVQEGPIWEPLPTKFLSMSEDVVYRLLGEGRAPADSQARASDSGGPCRGDIGEFLADSGVVLDGSALESIKSVWGFVRRNAVVREKWGFDTLKHAPPGLCLLFHGPSGTGKTLTARCLCRALGREPLVVSYPDLVSKWVGDTEKNTRAAFAEAARTDKVLVFDEADAVFARRTEVRHSTDRYANGEVDTLLMGLERFAGIVILTTNYAAVLDPALERRIQYKVYFGPPDAKARAEIWRQHLPAAAPLAPDTDLVRLAEGFKLTGGQIANAAMTAASLAASRLEDDSSVGQITMADLEAGARRELQGYREADASAKVGF